MHRTFWIVFIFSAALTLFINLPAFVDAVRSGNADGAMHLALESPDNPYYLSRIREVMDGYPLLGNPSLKEHRDAITPSGFAEVISGGVNRMLGLTVGQGIFLTNIIFPFLILLLSFLWIHAILRHRLLTMATILLAWDRVWNLTRDTSPKITLLFPSLYLALLLVPKRDTTLLRLLRGVLLGIMFHTYPYHWTLLLTFEVLLAAHEWLTTGKRWWIVARQRAAIFVPFLVLALPYALTMLHLKQTPEGIDTFRRFGAIESHFPGAPDLQAITITFFLALWGLWMTRLERSRGTLVLLLLLAATLIIINSNVITGVEGEFGGHYGRFAAVFFYTAAFLCIRSLLRPRTATLIASSFIALTMISAIRMLPMKTQAIEQAQAHAEERRIEPLMAWLNVHLPPESVILASPTIMWRIPVFTNHYVAFHDGSRLFFVTDRELAERYMLVSALFPDDPLVQPPESAWPAVFGLYAGQMYGLQKTMHRIASLWGGPPLTKTLLDFIAHQELRSELETFQRHPDMRAVPMFLDKYNIQFVILSSGSVPKELVPFLIPIGNIASYDIFSTRKEK